MHHAFSHSLLLSFAYLDQSRDLVKGILGFFPPLFIHLSPPKCLASAAHRPDWTSLDLVDVPLCQCFLSQAIDHAYFETLLRDSPNIHSKSLALSTSI